MTSTIPQSRKRGLSSSPTYQTLPSPRTRTWSHTLESSIYDEDYKHYIHESYQVVGPKVQPWDLSAPENVTSPDEMTARRVTPRTQAFFEEYRDAARNAMDQSTRDSQVQLFALNRILNSKVILYKEPSVREKKGQEAIKKLVQIRYLAEYGNYLAEQCKKIRDYSIDMNIEGLEYFTGSGQNWNVIQAKMEKEEKIYDEWVAKGSAGGPVAAPDKLTADAVRRACTALKFDHENTWWAIKWYSNRNDRMHCSVGVYIKNCDWPRLAQKLWKDIQELSHVFGHQEYQHMKKALNTIQDRYFYNLDDPNKPVNSVESNELTVARDNKLREKKPKTKKPKEDKSAEEEGKRPPKAQQGNLQQSNKLKERRGRGRQIAIQKCEMMRGQPLASRE